MNCVDLNKNFYYTQLSDQLDAVINSMKIVLAADESVRLSKQVSIT